MVSCIHSQDLINWHVTCPPELDKNVHYFVDYATKIDKNIKAKPLTIEFKSNIYHDGTQVMGLTSHRKHTIYLDSTHADYKSLSTALLMHELGHYVLDRRHTYDKIDLYDTCLPYPTSFMHYEMYKPSNYDLREYNLKEFYMSELFL